MLRSSLSLGNEAPEKANEKIGRKVGRGTLGVERRGGLESESTQALFKAMTTGLRTTGRGKVKVQEKEKAEPRGPGRDPWLGRQQQRQEGGSLAGLRPPWQPQALAPRDSLPLRSIVPLPGDKEIAF